MARPGAEIILSTQETDQLGWDIMAAQGQWMVLYKEEPVNVRSRHWTYKGEQPKYQRTTYPNPSSAENLAKKLNKLFSTTEFTVKRII